ncbi:MAG TPA: glycosyl hydrolase [Bryobacteraceae bacterium]|jgi:mannan endo-1,4-beta-mannosidase
MRKLIAFFVIFLGTTAVLCAQAAPPATSQPAPVATPQAAPPGPVPQNPPAPPPPRAQAPAPYNCEPVNPNATPEARALLKTLCAISGKGILSGQHNYPNQRDLDTEKVHALTGKYPAIWGSDFGFTDDEDKDSILHRDLMIAEAKKQAAAGSIIYLCWHMLRPTEDEPGKPGASWRDSVQARLSDDQWEELITPDTPLHKRWEKYMDTAAVYLKQLQDAHIPVLWRPMHENNGSFFWWGGRPGMGGTAQLYREVYARMVYVHHLDNLIWVWNQNAAPVGEYFNYFPGQRYVDVVSYDNYGPLSEPSYYEMLALADGKPITLGEVGAPPSAEVLKAQPRWAWFMVWAGMVNDRILPAYSNPYVINRGDPIPGASPAPQ